LNCVVENGFTPNRGQVILDAKGTEQNQRTEGKEYVCHTKKDLQDLALSGQEEGGRILWDGTGRGRWACLERR